MVTLSLSPASTLMSIAIISWPHDIHFLAIATALEEAGLNYRLIQGFDFPSIEHQSISINENGLAHAANIPQSNYSLNDYGTVWYRRGHRPSVAHISNKSDQTFIRIECENFLTGLRNTYSRTSRWLNHPEAQQRALNKMTQLSIAHALGIRIPDTLISNDPNEVERFLSRHTKVIGKTFTPAFWRTSETNDYAVSSTFEMTKQDLDSDIISAAPVIFQERLNKKREWRVCVFKDRIEAFIIFDSEIEEETHVDNRVSHSLPGRYAIRGDLPKYVIDWIMALISEFNLEMGQFDLIENSDGFVFLEINPGGQFLFLELWNKEAGLLSAFLEFLTQEEKVNDVQAKILASARFEMSQAFVSATDRISRRETARHSQEIEQKHVYVD